MQAFSLSEKLTQDIAPVIEGLGYSLVELKANRNSHNLHVSVVIYKSSGISLKDCSIVHRTIQPRIEVLENTRDVHIEVASPGVDRKISSDREYAIFSGKGVRIMTKDGTKEWKTGVIESADDNAVRIKSGDAIESVPFDMILKARLDYTQEVGSKT